MPRMRCGSACYLQGASDGLSSGAIFRRITELPREECLRGGGQSSTARLKLIFGPASKPKIGWTDRVEHTASGGAARCRCPINRA